MPRGTVSQVSIENPILNSPFVEPPRHFKFDNDGISNNRSDRTLNSSPLGGPNPRAAAERSRGSQFARPIS
jgi:type III restriction enzyme